MATKRAPVEYRRDAESGELVAEIAAGGTATVIADQAEYLDVSWISSAMSDDDHRMADEHPEGIRVALGDSEARVRLLQHDPSVFNQVQYYFANEVLWLVHHSLYDRWREPDFSTRTREGWEAYLALNNDFASALADRADSVEDPCFLVHDFQLLATPRFLRARHPDAPLLLFHHSPWPSAENWRTMPRYARGPLVEAMLSADVIGFFAHRWGQQFLDCVADVVPDAEIDAAATTVTWNGRRTRVATIPLGYSPAALSRRRPRLPKDIAEWAGDRLLVLHAGRTDPAKNAPRAVRAFVAAASNGGARDAVLLVKANPNRLYVAHNERYLEETETAVRDANRELGRDATRFLLENDVEITLGCFERADVLFLNSVADGMNLSAFEGALVGAREPVLVLSDGCGAAELLHEASRVVSAFDLEEQANAVAEALALSPTERTEEHLRLRAAVEPWTLPRWVDEQLRLLPEGAAR